MVDGDAAGRRIDGRADSEIGGKGGAGGSRQGAGDSGDEQRAMRHGGPPATGTGTRRSAIETPAWLMSG